MKVRAGHRRPRAVERGVVEERRRSTGEDWMSSPGASSSRVTLEDLAAREAAADRVNGAGSWACEGRGKRTWRRKAVQSDSISTLRSRERPATRRPPRRTTTAIGILSLAIPLVSATPIASASAAGQTDNILITADDAYSHAVNVNVPDRFIVLHQRFAPGFIVLSYLIAVIGSLCTLELLIRRTSNAGWRNKLLLSSAGICFGAVSTFSMHFVFNNALTLSHPDIQGGEALALLYGPGYTVLSLVASCMAMSIAFFVMGTNVSEWYGVPGSAARRAKRRQELKRGGEDYKRWKLQHKQGSGDGALGEKSSGEALKSSWDSAKSLVTRAMQVAKWSMVEHGLQAEPHDPYSHQAERDFRLGSGLNAKKVKDFDPTNDTVQMDPPSVSDGILSNKRSSTSMTLPRGLTQPYPHDRGVRLMPSDPALGNTGMATPTTVTTMGGDGSGPGHSNQPSMTDPSDVFAPGYSFPRPDSAASLLVRASDTDSPTFGGRRMDMNADALTMPMPAATPWTRRQSVAVDSTDMAFGQSAMISANHYKRRSSLPVFAPLTSPPFMGLDREQERERDQRERAGRIGDTYMNTLSRIQSLPESDIPIHPTAAPTGTSSDPKAAAAAACSSPHSPLGSKALMSPEFELEKGDLFSPKSGHASLSHKGSHRSRSRDHLDAEADAEHGLRRRRMHKDRLYGKVERFLGFDVVTSEDIWKIVLTGTIAGCGVAGMHYIGQLSIIGMPYIAYDPGYVVGSIVIACGAVVVALYIMFIMLRPKLKHHFLYKLCVAFILAVAVCCMHFCGMMGTTYAWPRGEPITRHDLLKGTNGAIVGIVSALAFAACLACGVFFLIEALKARRERKRRRRVVVAAIMLDEYDRVLVNSADGLPPMCDIASLSGNDMKSSKSTTFTPGAGGTITGTTGEATSTLIGMDLTPGHEAFISALKLSWFWRNPEYAPTASTLNHESAVPVSIDATLNEIRRGSFQTATTSMTSVSRPTRVTVTRFLEKFVMSSGQLASRLTGHSEGIQRIGVLYDQILTTGWVKLHNSSDTVSKGQLIILVRRVTSQIERDDLLTRHFIFADSSAVAVSLQKTLSVPLDHVKPLLQDVKLFCDSTARVSLQPGALYAGIAVVQATPFDGLRILLEQDNRSQLPMRELCTFAANPDTQGLRPDELGGTVEEIGDALTWLEGMSLVSIINRNMTAWRNANSTSQTRVGSSTGAGAGQSLGGPRVTALLGALERAIVPMLDEMLSSADMEHVIPRLSLHPMLVPLTPGTPRPDPRNTYVPPYAIVLYAHYDAAVNTFTDKWLPFNLFRAQNACVMARSIGVAAKFEEELRQSQAAAVQAQGHGYGYGHGHGVGQYAYAPSAYTFGSLGASTSTHSKNGQTPTHAHAHSQIAAIQGEAQWSRRPSKVQFEDEVEHVNAFAAASSPSALAPLSMSSNASTSPPVSPTGPTSGYVFPPPSGKMAAAAIAATSPPGSAGMAASTSLPASASPPSAYASGVGPAYTYGTGGSANAPAPRRSSLAKTTFQSPGEHIYPSPYLAPNATSSSTPLQQQLEMGRSGLPLPVAIQHDTWSEPTRGVAAWEADWLLVLLRTKLRADM